MRIATASIGQRGLNAENVGGNVPEPLHMVAEIFCISGDEAADFDGDGVRRVRISESGQHGGFRQGKKFRLWCDNLGHGQLRKG